MVWFLPPFWEDISCRHYNSFPTLSIPHPHDSSSYMYVHTSKMIRGHPEEMSHCKWTKMTKHKCTLTHMKRLQGKMCSLILFFQTGNCGWRNIFQVYWAKTTKGTRKKICSYNVWRRCEENVFKCNFQNFSSKNIWWIMKFVAGNHILFFTHFPLTYDPHKWSPYRLETKKLIIISKNKSKNCANIWFFSICLYSWQHI